MKLSICRRHGETYMKTYVCGECYKSFFTDEVISSDWRMCPHCDCVGLCEHGFNVLTPYSRLSKERMIEFSYIAGTYRNNDEWWDDEY